ncbi:MAG: 3,4-dihydroxy-2-butanone-4-phosphate synthase [Spirochaetaceae bacterium]|nr:MAG: 3,4-dihydroxy-2-butanone-4-phosphate synthase [Spirochaetaceae bacterium]
MTHTDTSIHRGDTAADTQSKRVAEAVRIVREGGVVIIVDDDDREYEGDFVAAGGTITPEAVNLMVTHGRGLLCAPISSSVAARLELPAQSHVNTSLHETRFTVSVDAVRGTTTGISVGDRAITIRALADPATVPSDLGRPGHIFPIVGADGGLAERRGHTEASLELVRRAGLPAAAAICEILDDTGAAARGAALDEIAERLGVMIIRVNDIAAIGDDK